MIVVGCVPQYSVLLCRHCMHLSHATSNIMGSCVPYIKDPSVDGATMTSVARLGICICSAHSHQGASGLYIRALKDFSSNTCDKLVYSNQLENAVIKTVVCVNLNNRQFQAVTNVALNATTRIKSSKVPLQRLCWVLDWTVYK